MHLTTPLRLSLAISKMDHGVLGIGLAQSEVAILNTIRKKQSLESDSDYLTGGPTLPASHLSLSLLSLFEK